MRYNRNKVATLMLMILFFWLYWKTANDSFFGVDTRFVLLSMNNSRLGYSSLHSYSTSYCLLYLIFVNGWISKENVILITRYKSRDQIIYIRNLNLGIASLIFVTVHIVVNVIRTSIMIQPNFLYNNYFYHASLVTWLGLILFYWWIGLLFQILIDYTKNNIRAILFTFLLIFIMYFMGNQILPFLWTPIEDMSLYVNVLSLKMDLIDIVIVYLKQLILGIGLFIIAKMIYEEKDILENEK